MYQKYYKRLFDIFLSSFLIIFFTPLMILIFFIVWLAIGFPIFTQKRPGLHNKIFTIYKFKTLLGASKNISEKKRRNPLGDFLRKKGLDELPQLFNIFSNKMSFVGPRPLLIKYLKFKGFRNHERSKCKPGITGLAQIHSFENSYTINPQCPTLDIKWPLSKKILSKNDSEALNINDHDKSNFFN